ncbi:MAG: fibrillarin-like rRNA/tRNA 2'-O-methyltransferase [Methanosarcinales archaeon]|nr:fibrillarin-like rRNA/tRNA 2'-O-methyltransferase [Methanosarcinales archaeon]
MPAKLVKTHILTNIPTHIPTHIPNVFFLEEEGNTRLVTKNLTPNIQVYGEKLITVDGIEYRLWSHHRSKLAGMIEKGMNLPLKEDSRILYLGAASGTTASHVSDIVAKGRVFAVEFSPRTMRDLIDVCSQRSNMVPVFADAGQPWSYKAIVGSVDVIYQDVAQPNQAGIALVNAREFLKEGGYLVMVIKARSVDSTVNPKIVYEQELDKLGKEFNLLDKKVLGPYHPDHLAVIAQRT